MHLQPWHRSIILHNKVTPFFVSFDHFNEDAYLTFKSIFQKALKISFVRLWTIALEFVSGTTTVRIKILAQWNNGSLCCTMLKCVICHNTVVKLSSTYIVMLHSSTIRFDMNTLAHERFDVYFEWSDKC